MERERDGCVPGGVEGRHGHVVDVLLDVVALATAGGVVQKVRPAAGLIRRGRGRRRKVDGEEEEPVGLWIRPDDLLSPHPVMRSQVEDGDAVAELERV